MSVVKSSTVKNIKANRERESIGLEIEGLTRIPGLPFGFAAGRKRAGLGGISRARHDGLLSSYRLLTFISCKHLSRRDRGSSGKRSRGAIPRGLVTSAGDRRKKSGMQIDDGVNAPPLTDH